MTGKTRLYRLFYERILRKQGQKFRKSENLSFLLIPEIKASLESKSLKKEYTTAHQEESISLPVKSMQRIVSSFFKEAR
jgi:hypothetical protein